MKIRVATRGSKLSLAQTEIVLNRIRRVRPDVEFELVIVKTRGDIHQDKPFTAIGGKGVFEKEVNLAVLEGKADIAVHSLKDVPSAVSPKLVLAMVPPRDPPYDVLVARDGVKTIYELPPGAVVGTASMRRKALIRHVRPDLEFEILRGNVDTRLRKLDQGLYDAIILAEAGLRRLEIERGYWRFPPTILPPAPGQGIIGVYAPYNRRDLLELLEEATDQETMILARAERAFLAYAGGGCHTPLGGYAWLDRGELHFYAAVASPDGSRKVEVTVMGDPDRPAQVGVEAALELRRKAKEAGVEYWR
jgi:hydroxymethylbilane synthase